MKLHANSAAFDLLLRAAFYGELPYHVLRLMPFRYECAKDAFQKLCRAGLLGVVKAPRMKCFYLTVNGYAAYCQVCQREKLDPLPHPEIIYDPHKALRLSRINEANYFFSFSGCSAYDTAREMKRSMERAAVRSTDNLRYSRFVGRFPTPTGLYVVYHFGGGNQRLNTNGERNAETALSCHPLPIRKLILADSEKAVADIFAYSLWVRRRSAAARRHLQLNFHITQADNPVVLPLNGQAQAFIRFLDRTDCSAQLAALTAQAYRNDRRTISLLNGGWNALLEYGETLTDPCSTLPLAIWEFQRPILEELRRRNILQCRTTIASCSAA